MAKKWHVEENSQSIWIRETGGEILWFYTLFNVTPKHRTLLRRIARDHNAVLALDGIANVAAVPEVIAAARGAHDTNNGACLCYYPGPSRCDLAAALARLAEMPGVK